MLSHRIVTPVGTLLPTWTERGLYSCEFTHESMPRAASPDLLGPEQHRLTEAIAKYFRSGMINWDLRTIDWSEVSNFQREALELCFKIPSGHTMSYGQVAVNLSNPNAARAVGRAMAQNRWPILIPCHRVVGSNGRLTGYSGAGGLDTKRQLLEQEKAWAGELLFP
ncbi:MAG: MGMT family protein [Planctomycetota bacterium]